MCIFLLVLCTSAVTAERVFEVKIFPGTHTVRFILTPTIFYSVLLILCPPLERVSYQT